LNRVQKRLQWGYESAPINSVDGRRRSPDLLPVGHGTESRVCKTRASHGGHLRRRRQLHRWELSDGADWYRDDVFTAIRSFLTKQTDQLLPEGYHLKITFTDIDLGHRASRRVPSASGAPAFEFNYQVTDSSGKVIKQGTEDLRHYTDFGNYRASIETTDLRTEIIQSEKPILKSWAFTRLANLK